jgi:hypothetical protein
MYERLLVSGLITTALDPLGHAHEATPNATVQPLCPFVIPQYCTEIRLYLPPCLIRAHSPLQRVKAPTTEPLLAGTFDTAVVIAVPRVVASSDTAVVIAVPRAVASAVIARPREVASAATAFVIKSTISDLVSTAKHKTTAKGQCV